MRNRFAFFIGGIALVVGTIALVANSYLLGRGAVRWAHEDEFFEKLALGAGGAIVPWLLAILPLLFVTVNSASWWGRVGHRVIIVGLWALFFGYNFMMGTSNLAKTREDKVAAVSHAAENLDAKRQARARFEGQLATIPEHRPPATVQAQIDLEKINKWYTNADNCKTPTSTDQRKGCRLLQQLEGELEAAKRADELNAKIDELDVAIDAAPAASKESADPFVDTAADLTGIPAKAWRVLLAMLTPVILEVIGASAWKIAFGVFGWSLKISENADSDQKPQKQAVEAPFNPAPLMSPELIKKASMTPFDELTAQRKLCDYFFKECTRPCASGALPEEDWYQHYSAICRRSNDKPLGRDTFRRIAAHHGMRISMIDGTTFYFEWLPNIPENAI